MPVKGQANVIAASVAVCVGLVTLSLCAVTKWWYKQRREWCQGGRVKAIFLYPIKSLPPIEVTRAELTVHGLKYEGVRDREFLILDKAENNKFITARKEPSLLLLYTTYDVKRNCLIIESRNSAKHMQPLEITLDDGQGVDTSLVLQVHTWPSNGPYKANSCDEKVSSWFSEYLEKDVIVVRLVGRVDAQKENKINSPGRFQDQAALNVLSERSVDNLVEIIRDSSVNVTVRNFRPSLLAETKYPFEEDFWYRIKIGNAETQFYRRCERCILTTIDPDTGVRTDKEPLTSLRRFRVDRSAKGILEYGFKPLLGCNHTVNSPGSISVGQTIFVEKASRELL